MKYTVVVSDNPQSVPGIQCFPLELGVTRLDFTEYELKGESRSVYVKILKPGATDGLQHPSDAQWYIADVDLPDDTWARSVEELAQQWLQLKASSEDLARLKEKTESLSPGWFPWTVNKALDNLSKTRAALTQIRQVVAGLDTNSKWRSDVSDMLSLVESLKEQNEAHCGIVQARKAKVDLSITVIIGAMTVAGIVLAILLN